VIGTFSPINGLDTETCGVKPFDIGDITLAISINQRKKLPLITLVLERRYDN
jgi:hypothetical protein